MSDETKGENNVDNPPSTTEIPDDLPIRIEYRGEHKTFMCNKCNKYFNQNTGLYNHMKRKHGISIYLKASIICKEPNCSFKCSMRDKLQAHLVSEHKKDLAFSTLKFSSMKEFEEWKEVFEKQEKCRFVKKSGTRVRSSSGEKHTYLYCSRSGTFVSNSKGKRVKGRKGSCKISNYCTASIDCIEELDGTVIARLCSTHYGHETSVEHLRLTKADKLTIADKLSQGVPRDIVLNNVRASIGESLDRIHFLTMKDIKNIEKSYGIKNSIDVKQKPEAHGFASVHEWIKEMDNLAGESPVMFYKQKGIPLINYMSSESSETYIECLDEDDFCLILITKGQKEIFKKFGQNGVFYATWMGITNGYDLSLLVLMLADDLNEAFPVAYMICSRIDNDTEVLFFKIIQERLCSFCARAIMTDDRKSLFDAWCSVMGFVPYYLLSNRYVDADWRDRLITVQNEDVQCAVYEVLYSYLSCTDPTKFEENLKAFVSHLKENEDTLLFGIYFEDNYYHRVRLWAGCYDKKSVGINEHLNLDIVYNELLGVCNNKGKFSKLLDKTLQGLLTIVRDRQFNRNSKIAKQAQELAHHHEISNNISLEGIQHDENRKWQIKSESANLVFTVTRKTYECTTRCPLICTECKMCAHIFECTCKVYNFDRTMCKHIHAIGRLFQKSLKVLEGIDLKNKMDLALSNKQIDGDEEEVMKNVVNSEELKLHGMNSFDRQNALPEIPGQKECGVKFQVLSHKDKMKLNAVKQAVRSDEKVFGKPTEIIHGNLMSKKIENIINNISASVCNVTDPRLLKLIFIKLKKVKLSIDSGSVNDKIKTINVKKEHRPKKLDDIVENESKPLRKTFIRKAGRPKKAVEAVETGERDRPRTLQEIIQDDLLREELAQKEVFSEAEDESVKDKSAKDKKSEKSVANMSSIMEDVRIIREQLEYLPKKRGRRAKLKDEDETDDVSEVDSSKKLKLTLENTSSEATRRSKRVIKKKNFDIYDSTDSNKKKVEARSNSGKKTAINSDKYVAETNKSSSNSKEKNTTSVIRNIKKDFNIEESVKDLRPAKDTPKKSKVNADKGDKFVKELSELSDEFTDNQMDKNSSTDEKSKEKDFSSEEIETEKPSEHKTGKFKVGSKK